MLLVSADDDKPQSSTGCKSLPVCGKHEVPTEYITPAECAKCSNQGKPCIYLPVKGAGCNCAKNFCRDDEGKCVPELGKSRN